GRSSLSLTWARRRRTRPVHRVRFARAVVSVELHSSYPSLLLAAAARCQTGVRQGARVSLSACDGRTTGALQTHVRRERLQGMTGREVATPEGSETSSRVLQASSRVGDATQKECRSGRDVLDGEKERPINPALERLLGRCSERAEKQTGPCGRGRLGSGFIEREPGLVKDIRHGQVLVAVARSHAPEVGAAGWLI